MLLIQFFLIIFFIFAIFKSFMRWKKGEITLMQVILWCIFWLVAGGVVLLPNSTSYFARFLGVGRGADLIVYLALALLFYLFFRQSVRIEKMNREITKLTREIALKDK